MIPEYDKNYPWGGSQIFLDCAIEEFHKDIGNWPTLYFYLGVAAVFALLAIAKAILVGRT